MGPRITVIAYHAIGDCDATDDRDLLFLSPATFEAQMGYLARHRQVVSLEDAASGSVPAGKPAVAITFDDGYRVLVDHALPVLERHGFPATVFVPTGHLGDRNRWDPPSRCPLEIMSAEDLRDAEARGLLVESHGHQHISLADASFETARDDLAHSIDVLRELIGRTPRFLAYPFSEGSLEAQRAAESLGFVAGFNISGRDGGPFARARVAIARLDPHWVFGPQTSGYYPWVRNARPPALALSAARRLRYGRRARRPLRA